MRAVYLTGHGGNEVIAVGERPRPVRQPGEVLVRLHAATLNRVDLYMRDSGAGITHALPMIMGLDGAGVGRIFIRQLQILGSTLGDLGEFRDLLALVQRTRLDPVIDSDFALGDVHAALDRLESGEQFGKVVVNVRAGA